MIEHKYKNKQMHCDGKRCGKSGDKRLPCLRSLPKGIQLNDQNYGIGRHKNTGQFPDNKHQVGFPLQKPKD